MRRLAWTFAARIGYKYQIRLTRPKWEMKMPTRINWNYSHNQVVKHITALYQQIVKEKKQTTTYEYVYKHSGDFRIRPSFFFNETSGYLIVRRENVSSGVSDQARHKPASAATQASYSLEISAVESRDIILSKHIF